MTAEQIGYILIELYRCIRNISWGVMCAWICLALVLNKEQKKYLETNKPTLYKTIVILTVTGFLLFIYEHVRLIMSL